MKAIALISGGLDSSLAARIIQDLGIELLAFNNRSPFCLCNHRSSTGCINSALTAANRLNLKLVSVNVTEELLKIVKKPKFGYGSNMNPCIDCRILLFKKAKECMQKEGASFIVTGEVLGQRPMSQRIFTIRLIEKEAGLDGLVVRPLCAKLLKPTIPEESGWIDRNKLLGINGRGRKQQISMAREFGINDYPCPSGGCLLTDPGFSRRLKDLMRYAPDFSPDDINLLKIGRHFRVSQNAKLVVGRNEIENQKMINLAIPGDYIFMPEEDVAGPTCLGRGEFSQETIEMSCGIASRYCDLERSVGARLIYMRFPEKQKKTIELPAFTEERVNRFHI